MPPPETPPCQRKVASQPAPEVPEPTRTQHAGEIAGGRGPGRPSAMGPSPSPSPPRAERGYGDGRPLSLSSSSSRPTGSCQRRRRGQQENNAASAAAGEVDEVILSAIAADFHNPFSAVAAGLDGNAALAPTFLLSARSSLVAAATPSTSLDDSTRLLTRIQLLRSESPDESTNASLRTITTTTTTNLDDKETPTVAAEMRAARDRSDGFGVAGQRNLGTYHLVEDCSSMTTASSVFHLDGTQAHAYDHTTSSASSSRMFSGLMPPTPMTDQRPSSSQSHLTHGLDVAVPDEARISSESAMTVLQRRESPYRRRRLEPRWKRQRGDKSRQDEADDIHQETQVVDVTASMTREEFEALPPAIRRKYFTILERHRFLEQPLRVPVPVPTATAPAVDSDILDARIPTVATTSKRPRERPPLAKPPPTDLRRDRPKRRSSRRASFYLNLPDKIRRQHLTTEEQIVVSKLRRQNHNDNSKLSPVADVFQAAARLPVRPRTMESNTRPADSFYDSFRWLEEDKELDLKLHLDDYHANLRQDLPPATESRRPSFRRTMSITKLPFGRSSISSSRPGTMQTSSSPGLPRYTPTSPTTTTPPAYTGRRSRALSWMSSSKQNQLNNNVNVNSPAAKHSAPPVLSPRTSNAAANSENARPYYHLDLSSITRSDHQAPSTDEDRLRTFLSDDKSSIYSDEDASVADPQSPVTPPLGTDKGGPRPLRLDEAPAAAAPKPSGEFLGAPSSREITVRMTLTRADLRAKDDELYGWQARRRRTLLEDYDPITCAREGNSKESIERQLAAMDQWHAQVGERGKMKRLWHKVRGT